MSIIFRRIPDFNPIRNPLRVGMVTSGPGRAPGAAPEWFIDILDGINIPNVGQTFTLDFIGTTVVFSQATLPDPLAGEYGGPTDVDVADSLESAFLANYFISTYFNVTRSAPNQLHIVGRDIGTAYGLLGATVTLNTPGVLTTFEAGGGYLGGDTINEENYGALLQVWVEDTYLSDSYEKKLEEVYPVGTNNYAEADIARALRAYLAEPFMPAASMSTAQRMGGTFKRFMVRAAETYGDPAVVYAMREVRGKHFYLAGRSEVARVNTDWDVQMRNGSLWRFLTNWPNTNPNTPKRVRASQREFLCVLAQTGTMDELVVRADIYYTDYTVAMGTFVDQYTGGGDIQAGELVAFPVGVEQMGLDDFVPAKTISHYTIYLTDFAGTTVYTEKRYFRLDREHHEHLRQFHYLSSAGGIDTLALVGPRNETTDVDMTRSNRYVRPEPGNVLDARDNADVLEMVNTVMELGTEHLHQDELEALRDLLGSERIVERVNGVHWPVEMLVNKLDLKDEAGGRMPAKLKYRYALRNTANTLGT